MRSNCRVCPEFPAAAPLPGGRRWVGRNPESVEDTASFAHPRGFASLCQHKDTMKLDILERGIRLANAHPASIANSRGSDTAFSLMSALTVGLGLDDRETLHAIEASGWNDRCLPPWSHRELTDKIRRCRRDCRREPGYLLKERNGNTPRPLSKASKPVPRTPEPPRPYTVEELEEKAHRRSRWTSLRPLTEGEIGAVAKVRDCPIAAVEILCQNGLLLADETQPGCYVLQDRTFRQYRRADGSSMPCGQKSQNAPGSLAKGFFCRFSQFRNLEPDDLIFIVEGAIGLLECVAIQKLSAPLARRWKFLASHSKSSRFFYEPELLAAIAGRHCRILPDPGKAGTDAARALRDELRAVRCPLDFAKMPQGFGDLRVILAAGTGGVAAAKSILSYPAGRKGGPL